MLRNFDSSKNCAHMQLQTDARSLASYSLFLGQFLAEMGQSFLVSKRFNTVEMLDTVPK